MTVADEVHRRIALQLAASVDQSRAGWPAAPVYVRKHLGEHAAEGGVLDRLVREVEFLGAAEPQRIVPLLQPLTQSTDSDVAGLSRAYLRLGADRVGPTYGQRIANLVLSCAAEEPEVGLRLGAVEASLPWKVNFAIGSSSPYRAAPGAVSQDLLALASGVVDGRPVVATGDLAHHIQVWDGGDGRLITSWRAHYDALRGLQFVDLGGRTVLVSASLDGTVCVWAPLSGDLTSRITSGSPITCVSVLDTTAEPIVAAGHPDGVIKLWSLSSGAVMAEVAAHRDGVSCLTFGGQTDSPFLASGSLDRIVSVWEAPSMRRRLGLAGPTGSVLDVVAFSRGGRDVIAAAGSDESVWLWDATTGEEILQLKEHAGAVTSLAVAELRGKTVFASGSADMTVLLWDLETGRSREAITGHLAGIRAMSIVTGPARPLLLVAAADRTVRAWDLDTESGMSTSLQGGEGQTARLEWSGLQREPAVSAPSSVGTVRCVHIWRNETELLTAVGGTRGSVQVRRMTNGALLNEWAAHEGAVLSLAAARVGGRVQVASGGMDRLVRSWDSETGRLLQEFEGHTHSVWGVSFGSVDGDPYLASASRDRSVRIWDIQSGHCRRVLQGSQERLWGVACDEVDGRSIVAAGSTDRTVWIWDVQTGRQLARLSGPARGVRYLAFSRLRGRPILAASGASGEISVWDLSADSEARMLKGHSDGVWGLAAGSIANRAVLVSASDDLTVRLWDLAYGRSMALPQSSPAFAVDLVDGVLAIGTNRHVASLSLTDRIFDEMDG